MDESEPDLRFERMDKDKVSVSCEHKGKMVRSCGLLLEKSADELRNLEKAFYRLATIS